VSRRKVGNPLALAVLACLFERPMHPYEMATTMRERHKDESIKLNYGSLYAVVEALLRNRLIAEQETSRHGKRPERTVYCLTDAGRMELIDWLSELLSTPAKEFTQFEAGLSLLPVLAPGDAVRLLEERCRRLEIELAQAATTREVLARQNLPRLFIVEAEYRWRLKEAELEWTRSLAADIASGALEGVEQWREWHRGVPEAGHRGEGVVVPLEGESLSGRAAPRKKP
jgi:DNA-binding PadR family transcriptional regulator